MQPPFSSFLAPPGAASPAEPAGRPMKIGVLTFHRCINYGSYWQARCLVEALRALGHRAVLLDHRSPRVDRAEGRCALRPVLPTPVPPADRRAYARKTRSFFDAFEALPLSRRFALEAPSEMEDFDTVVVGSDEVWNLAHPWYGHCPLFFGEGLRARRLVAYAASFGAHAAGQGLPQPWAGMLRRFHSVSVRDANSCALLLQALGHAPALVLDPCLLHAPDAADDGAHRARDGAPRHVAVYGHNFSPWFSARLREAARQRGLKLVSIGYRNDWADTQWLTAGPEDFARFMAGADAVATNFFHGCVFALRHRRPLLCEHSPYRAIKINDLLGTLGAREHLAEPGTPAALFDAALSTPPAAAVAARIAAMRAASADHLRRALQDAPAHVHA